MSLPDRELIARVVAFDDRHAFAELVRRHQSGLRNFLRRLTRRDDALADDLAQETLVEAYRNLGRFAGNSEFSSWLLGIAYNRFRMYLRKRREVPMDLSPSSEYAESEGGADPRAGSELGQDLQTAVAKLRAEEQTALELCYGQGLSHEDAAGLMGCPMGTLKSYVMRAKLRLRDFLKVYAQS